MTVIVCLDNANGMMFNHRRQSRDANVVNDILKTINGASLLIAPTLNRYSLKRNAAFPSAIAFWLTPVPKIIALLKIHRLLSSKKRSQS